MDPVLSFIGKLGPKESLSLKGLSLKLGFLLAVTSMDRVSEVVSHDLRVRRFSPPNRLLLSYIRPHKPITSDTLGRRVKEVLARAGIDTNIFKAHLVRGASATAAHNKGASLEDILHLADWSTDSMFRRFYYRPTHNPGPARSLVNTPYE